MTDFDKIQSEYVFGDRLRSFRESRNLSTRDASVLCSMNHQQYKRTEEGRRPGFREPGYPTIRRIIRAVNADPRLFFPGPDANPSGVYKYPDKAPDGLPGFGPILQSVREARGLSHQDLSELCGWGRTNNGHRISRIEDRIEPRYPTICRVIAALGADAREFFPK